MTPAKNLPPHSLGLWGDGDEIAALRDVERKFAVQLNYSDACNWVTASDVFAALQRTLPASQAQNAETWRVFAEAISAVTGVDPAEVKPSTTLLGTRQLSWKLSILVSVVAGVVLAIILHR